MGIRNGKNFKVVDAGDKDPGYAGTARMIGGAFVCQNIKKNYRKNLVY